MNERLNRIKGPLCGILAAVCYGTNPLGALPLYAEHYNASTILFYRYALAALSLGVAMAVRRSSFRVSRRELGILASLGVIFAISSFSLYTSFLHMEAGVASTLLFVYPIMVALGMALFFHERITWLTVTSILLALGGIGLLYRGDGGSTLSLAGVALVMLSSLTYAVYIIVVNRAGLRVPSLEFNFYVLLFCTLSACIYAAVSGPDHRIMLLQTATAWGWAFLLAWLPTVLSLVFMLIAVQTIGSTPTAILGALEPLTAVVIGAAVFGETITPRLAAGIVLILTGVILIIGGKSLSRQSLAHMLTQMTQLVVGRRRRHRP